MKNVAIFILIAAAISISLYYYINRSSKGTICMMQESKNPRLYIFLGAPGSGKGTLSENLIAKKQFEHLSTGNLCRINIDQQTEIGKKIDAYCKSGQLVPDDIIIDMVRETLKNKLSQTISDLILDGFPRTKEQAIALKNLLSEEAFKNIETKVVHINIPDFNILVDRLTSRIICSNKDCQATYSLKDFKDKNPMICPRCQSELKKRADDEVEAIKKRLETYRNTEATLLEFFAEVKTPIITIDGTKAAEEVYEQFLASHK